MSSNLLKLIASLISIFVMVPWGFASLESQAKFKNLNPTYRLLKFLKYSPNYCGDEVFNQCIRSYKLNQLSEVQIHAYCMLSNEARACIQKNLQRTWNRNRVISYSTAINQCVTDSGFFGEIYYNSPLVQIPEFHLQNLNFLFDPYHRVPKYEAEEALFALYGKAYQKIDRLYGPSKALVNRLSPEIVIGPVPLVEPVKPINSPQIVKAPRKDEGVDADLVAYPKTCFLNVGSLNVRANPSEVSPLLGSIKTREILVTGEKIPGTQASSYSWYPVQFSPWYENVNGFAAAEFIFCPNSSLPLAH